jgi:CBS domain-containing protein
MALLVRHVMAESPKTASPEMNASDAAGLMASFDIGVVPVVDGERLLGLVTDRDLVVRVLVARQDPMNVRLGDIVTRGELVTVTPGTRLPEARELMAQHKVRRLPVVQDTRLVGIVSLGDLAEADASARAIGDTLKEVSESPATTDRNSSAPDPGTPDRVIDARRSP